jgi:hypothetical protein
LNQPFSNAEMFLELLILQRLRFTNCGRLGRLRHSSIPIALHDFHRWPSLAIRHRGLLSNVSGT